MANVIATVPRTEITASATQTQFSWVNYLILQAQDLKAIHIPIATGTPVTLVNVTDFTIDGGSLANEAGGTITLTVGSFPTGAANGDIIIILRDTIITRSATFTTGGFFPASTVELEETDEYLIMQETSRSIARSLHLPDTLVGGVSDWVAPTPVDGQVLAWSGLTGLLVNASPVGLIDSSMYNQIVTLTFADSPFIPSLAQEGALFRIDTAAGNVVVNLAALSVNAQDNKYSFVKITGDANTVTINRGGTDTFDDALTSLTLSSQQFLTDIIGQLTSGVWQTKQHATGGGGAVTSVFSRSGAVVAVAGDYTAALVTNVPAGDIAAITVQAAIDELDAEKQPLDAALTDIAAVTLVHGDIFYVDSGPNIVKLSPGTSGQLLQTNGAAADPSWESAGGGAWEFIATSGALSGATEVDFDSGITFSDFVGFVWLCNARASVNPGTLGIRVSTDGGSSYLTTVYAYVHEHRTLSGGAGLVVTGDADNDRIVVTLESGTLVGDGMFGLINAGDLNDSDTQPNFWWQGIAVDGSGSGSTTYTGAGRRDGAVAVNGVRFLLASGNFEDGEIIMYGLKNS